MAKKMKKAAPRKKISPASKQRTKSEMFSTLADYSDLKKSQVAAVFDGLGQVLGADLGRGVVCTVPGLMKVTVVNKPATKARRGINPFTKQEVMFKAKPARKVVKVRALKGLKSMV